MEEKVPKLIKRETKLTRAHQEHYGKTKEKYGGKGNKRYGDKTSERKSQFIHINPSAQ